MIFIAILILTAITVSACAGYFSVYGLALMFTGAFYPVILMGSALEIAKLVSASYVYRFWTKINFILKSYLITAILILMLITSVGIFGFLSAAYQKDSIPLKEMTQVISLLKAEKTEILFRKRQIDKDISSLPPKYISGRERLMKKYGPELTKINSRLDDINSEVHKISKNKLNQEAHTGPIIYIASVFNRDVDDAIKYLILLFIFVFDPLAVVLTICANIAIRDYKSKSKKEPIILEDNNYQKTMDSIIISNDIKKKIRNNEIKDL